MAKGEEAGKLVKKVFGGLFGGSKPKATTASIPKFDISGVMRGTPGPSSVWPRPAGSFQGVTSRLGQARSRAGAFLNKPRGPLGIIGGLGAIAIGAGGARSFWDSLGGDQYTGALSAGPTGPTYAELLYGGPSQKELLEQLYASPAFTQTVTPPNYVGQVAGINAQTRKSLEDYLTTVEGMGKQSAKSIADAYAAAAKETAALGETQQVRGQDLAAQIDRLYQDLGLAEAQLAAGGGVSGEPTQISGLVPMGGEMATAQQTTPTYGASLADYLGREATIGGQALAQQALSQAEQGAGTATGLQNMIALAAAQQRFAADQAAADRLLQAQMADAEFANQLEIARQQDLRDQAARLFEAGQVDAEIRREAEAVLREARANAATIWDSATGELKKQLRRDYFNKTDFVAAATENPAILNRFMQ